MLYKVEELWDSTINLQSDNHRNSQPCCYHISAYMSESHQAISGAGVRTAEWHWKAKTHSPPLGAWTLTLIGVVISVTQKGAIWLPNLDWEWELACLSLLLKALRALNINVVQLASHPYSYCCRTFNAFPAASWLKILSHFSQQLIDH